MAQVKNFNPEVKPGDRIERGGPVSSEFVYWKNLRTRQLCFYVECDEAGKWRDIEEQWLQSLPTGVIQEEEWAGAKLPLSPADEVIKSVKTLLEVTQDPAARAEIQAELDKLLREQSDKVFDSTLFPTKKE